MNGVYFSNPNNSTFFTECCRVAIQPDHARCPACKQLIYPARVKDDGEYERARWRAAQTRIGEPCHD